MKSKKLHIICFDVPHPVSHGGFFDLFYKLKWLHASGVSILLHCFEYGRGTQTELNKYCEAVYYYRRKSLSGLSFHLPYIVSSRRNKILLARLAEDNFPVLIEGTHCTYLLYKNCFPDREILYRLHNIEHLYYKHLYRYERSVFKKLYFLLESILLKNYEKKVCARATAVLAVSENDVKQMKVLCPQANIQYLPLFVPFQEIKSYKGKGDYLLYHGNLSIAENQETVYWLLKTLNPLQLPFIIAGRNPSGKLKNAVRGLKFCQLVQNPSDSELEKLIHEAHINLVIAFNKTGIKLKLLHVLYSGRHCIANTNAISNKQLSSLCHIADTSEEVRNKITELMHQPFSKDEIEFRNSILPNHFDNAVTAKQFNGLLWRHYQ